MIKRAFLLALLLLVCRTGWSQVLYEVSGNGLKEKSYILGCNHLLASGILTGVPGVFRAYNQCERVVGEFETDEQNAMAAMLRYGKAEQTLDEILLLDDVAFVDSMLRRDVGVGLQMVMMFKPAIISAMWIDAVAQNISPRGNDDEPMDSYFQKMAVIDGKEVNALESFDDQMEMLLRGSEAEQARELLVVMREGKDKLRVDIEALAKMYVEGDLQGLADVEKREMSEALRLEMVEDRNEKWIGKMIDMMREKRCLVVVRAMNMVGNAGLPRALRAKGFFVKPVRE